MKQKRGLMREVFAALALLIVLAPGCAIFGRQQKDHKIDPEAVRKVQRGMSKEEVTSILGAPTEIIFSNKEHDPLREHAYVFEHTTTKYTGIALAIVNFGNSDEKRDRVLVFFDEGGRVDHVGATLKSDDTHFWFPFGQ